MGQMQGRDVTKAVGMFGEEQGDLGPTLTNEQAREFSELAQIKDPEEKAAKTSAKITELLKAVEEGDRKVRELFGQAGIESDEVQRFMESDRFSTASREELNESTKRFQDEVMRAVSDEAIRLSAGSTKKSTAPKMGRLRV